MRSKLLGIALGPVVAGTVLLAAAPAYAAPASSHAAVPATQPRATMSTTTFPVADSAALTNATFTASKFVNENGVLALAGTVTGTLPSGQTISTPASAAVTDPPSGSCQILDLTLGPLHLDLLGLVVDLNQVHLTINAQQGPGNLLGNLLCSVAGLLDSGNATTGLANLLNQLIGSL